MASLQIPVLRPRLPSADALLPYLGRMDKARIYSNFGPLVIELERRLASRLGVTPPCIVTAANATLLLTAALLAQSPRPGALCVMPAWTFVASPLAAVAAGLTPYFVDVSPEDWLLKPEAVALAVPGIAGDVGAVMPVAAFGQPIDVAAWDAFRSSTGIAVVIDSAAGFDAAGACKVPNVVSLHATKALGAGEGGFLASADEDLVQAVRSYLSFGFAGSREAQVLGFNGKLSEYHAAVGLAALDEWSETRQALVARAAAYEKAFRGANAIRLQPGFGEGWIANTLTVELPERTGDRIAKRLAESGIDTRHWWGRGAHVHKVTMNFPRGALPVTEALATSTLGLPFYVDMPFEDIERVAAEVLLCIAA